MIVWRDKMRRKVSPKRVHAIVQFAAASALKRCAAGRGTVGPEWRFKLAPGTQLVPDVAYVSYERLRDLPVRERERVTVDGVPWLTFEPAELFADLEIPRP